MSCSSAPRLVSSACNTVRGAARDVNSVANCTENAINGQKALLGHSGYRQSAVHKTMIVPQVKQRERSWSRSFAVVILGRDEPRACSVQHGARRGRGR
jgi:hypothetical protein